LFQHKTKPLDQAGHITKIPKVSEQCNKTFILHFHKMLIVKSRNQTVIQENSNQQYSTTRI